MFDLKEIIRVIKVFEESENVGELNLKYKEFELKLKKKGEGNVVPVQAVPAAVSVAPQIPAAAPASVQTPQPETAATQEEPKEEKTSENLYTLRSPMVGTFYRRPDPDSPPYVEVGTHINAGEVVCIIEAMKLFNEVKSEVSGTVKKILVNDQDPVEFDQPLLLIELD